MDNQSFIIGYPALFMQLIIAIIILYGFIMLLNFLRDKFLSKDSISKDAQIVELLIILNKLFILGGIGFIVGSIVKTGLTKSSDRISNNMLNMIGTWDYLTFGIILIFIGIGFKVAKKVILEANQK